MRNLLGSGQESVGPRLSVVLSFRNEEAVIPELLRRLRAVLEADEPRFELLFVNDDSTDGSLTVLLGEAARDRRIKVLTMARRFGVQACLTAGLEHASGDSVVMMDADLQDPPELVPVLLAKRREGFDVVHAVRSARDGESFFKILLTRLAYGLIRTGAEVDLPVEAGDFKLLSRRAVNELLKMRERQPYLRGLIASLGFRQASVPYRREKRFAGRSHFPVFSSGPVSTLISGMTSFSAVPIFLAWIFGAASFLAGSLVFMARGCSGVPGLAGILLCGFAAQFFLTGILGLYLVRILRQAEARPLYRIENAIGFADDEP